MSLPAFLGAIELGFVYGLVALGVLLSFRVLNFPDLTVDGSLPLGAAVTAALIVADIDPWLATAAAIVAGAAAGLVTAWLNLRFGILHLLASILVMIALYSINIRIMGRPNLAILTEPTILDSLRWLGLGNLWLRPLVAAVFALGIGLLIARLLVSERGLALRATGANPVMAKAQGIATGTATYAGMALSNALVALAGSLFAQMNGFADVTIGVGTIVVGLAAVIVGEALIPARRMLFVIAACLLGSLVYRLAIAFALNSQTLGLKASDLNLATAVLVALALILPQRRRLFARKSAG